MCQKDIRYLKKLNVDFLRQLYYHTQHRFYEYKEALFTVGDVCDTIHIVMSGVIDIMITDGYDQHQRLDVLGKGSIIGSNFILLGERWFCTAINNTN